MKYNELTMQSSKKSRRSGRGIAAGRGKTAGRGTKGQGARKSGGVRPGFEGGQMPLYMRLPKLRGFKSKRPDAETVYTGDLEQVKGSVVSSTALYEVGLISSPYVKAKLITKGEVTAKKEVKLPAASASAIELVQNAGGSFTQTPQLKRPASLKKSPKTK